MSEAISPNTTIAQYTIVSKIGEGGMGEVYRARDTKLGRDVAIKVLPSSLSENIDRLNRFEQEAQAAGSLNHPNILVIYHIGTHEGAPYIVSELLEGETLRARMGGVALPQRKAIDYALQIANGLSTAHQKGIIHRDLKPENLFVTKDGRLKILDFGLAKLSGAGDASQSETEIPTRRVNTDPGVVMGTIGYMSPEQLRGKPTDHRSDIFSFGAVLYEMLSGRRAFRGESTADTMSAILREDPPDLSGTNRNINPALERIVNHCLEKNPGERFNSAGDLAFAIEALSNTAGTSEAAETILSALPPAKRKARNWLAWSFAGLLLISTVVLGWLYFRRTAELGLPVRFVIASPQEVTEVSTPAISPDGRMIAFLGMFEGKRYLYTRSLNSLETQRMAGTEDATSPFWSPDSRYLAFFSTNKLKKIEATGGSAQTLCDAPSLYGGTWNRDGVILVGVDNKGISRVSSAGGSLTQVLELDASRKEQAHAWPSFLPDGKHFIYQSWAGASETSAIFVASIDGGERKLLLKEDSSPSYIPGYLLFARGSTLMAQAFSADKLQVSGEPFPVAEGVTYIPATSYASVSISENGTMVFLSGGLLMRQLVWFDRSGKKLEQVGSPGWFNDIVLSPDGKKLAIQQLSPGTTTDIWLMDFTRGTSSRFTFGPTIQDSPVWSPDGSQVIYMTGADGQTNFLRKASSGAGSEERIFESENGSDIHDWSRDGRLLLFTQFGTKTGADLWVLPMSEGDKPFPVLQTDFVETRGQFSPDGKWLVYASNESGETEVYVQNFPPSGGKWLISTNGGSQPRWRADGKELFYVAPDKTLMAVGINATSTFEMSKPVPLFTTQVSSYTAPNRYVVSADGQRFLVNSPAGETSRTPITVVLNWVDSLKR